MYIYIYKLYDLSTSKSLQARLRTGPFVKRAPAQRAQVGLSPVPRAAESQGTVKSSVNPSLTLGFQDHLKNGSDLVFVV